MSPTDFKEVIEGWLARAENPASGLEAEVYAAREKIKQLEHAIIEGKKVAELKEQEENIKVETLEKVIMAMACEIKSLQEGNEPLLSSGKEKALKEAREKLKKN